ncbi:phosphotransferase family protein [Krasilnikovia sp. MM14-A1259]|uniref:phosphotransferase family protein n=1 Tax=Krasilnikovia sp. MM14-A1259 TaxID=3373539 RepID=UPI00382D53AB
MLIAAAALARRAVLQAGLSPEGLRPLRVHSNAVFLLPGQRVVVRVGGGADAPGRATRAVACTRWLVGIAYPAVEPLPGVHQPVLLADEAGGHWAATFWRQVDVEDRPPAAADLGRLLRRLHHLPAPPFELPFFRPLERLVAAASDSTWLSKPDRDWLLDRAAHLQAELDGAAGPAECPVGLVHGDAQLGNVLAAVGGRAVLGDWDGVALAPLLWDVVPTAVEPRFGGSPQLLEELLAGYGDDLTGVPGWRVLYDVYELRSVAAHIRRAPESAPHAAQAALRIASLRAGDRTVRWSAVG